MQYNLLSLGELDEMGVVTTIRDGQMTGVYRGVLIYDVKKTNNVWKVNFTEVLRSILRQKSLLEKSHMPWLSKRTRTEEPYERTLKDMADIRRIADEAHIWDPEREEVRQLTEIHPSTAPEHSTSHNHTTNIERTLHIHHLRFAHRNYPAIISDTNNNLITSSLNKVRKLSTQDIPKQACRSCRLVKSKALPRPAKDKVKRPRTTKENDLPERPAPHSFPPGTVCTDTTGPYTVDSYDKKFRGNQDFMFMNSKFVIVYGYKNKSDAFENLKQFIDVDAKLLKIDISRYHSDGAQELSGNEVRKYLNSKGITVTTSTAYRPEENSYIERHFGSEYNSAAAMLEYARCIPKSFWFLSKETYTHIYNRLPTSTDKGRMSPYQYLTGKVPDLSYLRIWGSKAFVNIPTQKRDKSFNDRALIGYLVGYSERHRNAYKIWIPKFDKVIVSRDVTFDEEIPQGDINYETDTYWKELRESKLIIGEKQMSINDFQYLVGVTFFDPDINEWRRVLEIRTYKGHIIAALADYDPQNEDSHSTVEIETMHVADVEKLLGSFSAKGLEEVAAPFTDSSNEHPDITNNPHETITIAPDTSPKENECMHTQQITNSDNTIAIRGRPNKSTRESDEEVMNIFLAEYEAEGIDPKTYNEAMSGRERNKWKEAIQNEWDNLKRKGVFIEVDTPSHRIRKLGTKWVFKKKIRDGDVYKFKCRLTAKGFKQIEGVDYGETFAPVARSTTLRIVIKIAIEKDMTLMQIDFTAAFLNALLNEELYLEDPEGYTGTSGKILKLVKSLYGLKQAGRNWYITLKEHMKLLGFSPCIADPCLFIKEDMLALIYVDDMVIGFTRVNDYDKFKKDTKDLFEIGEESPLEWYLGISFKKKGKSYFLNQTDYLDRVLNKYEVDRSKTSETPMIEKFVITKLDTDELYEDYDLRGKVGSLMYAAILTRPDICFAVSYIARFVTHPSAAVCRAIDRLFAYIAGSLEYGIAIEKANNIKEELHVDADYGGDVNDAKSTSGVITFVGSTPVSWYSSKQKTVAQSSTDAEALALNFATKEVVWLREILRELGNEISRPTMVHTDSASAIAILENPCLHSRTKHLRHKIAFIMEKIEEEDIRIVKILGENNSADMLTKGQKHVHFIKARNKVMRTLQQVK